MIAYLILVHRFPQQFKRMFRAIFEPGNYYLIHVDKSSGPELHADIKEFLKPYQNTAMLESRRAVWGGYSLVDAELRGMKKLLEMGGNWTHFINLSGQDFPLKSQAYIRAFVEANPGKQFIRSVDQQVTRPDTMNRLSHFFIEGLGRIFRTRVRRAALADVVPQIGTQWKLVDRAFCTFITQSRLVDRFRHFYRYSLIPDEAFFQTVMANTPGHGAVINDDLRCIDWVADGPIKLRPRTFTSNDAMRLTLSPDLFARKFDAKEDSLIFALLERHLKTPAALHYQPDFAPQPEILPIAA